MEAQYVGEHDGDTQEETSERVVLFGNGNIVETWEDIVHLTTEPWLGRESLRVHVMPNRYTPPSLPFRSASRRSSMPRARSTSSWYVGEVSFRECTIKLKYRSESFIEQKNFEQFRRAIWTRRGETRIVDKRQMEREVE